MKANQVNASPGSRRGGPARRAGRAASPRGVLARTAGVPAPASREEQRDQREPEEGLLVDPGPEEPDQGGPRVADSGGRAQARRTRPVPGERTRGRPAGSGRSGRRPGPGSPRPSPAAKPGGTASRPVDGLPGDEGDDQAQGRNQGSVRPSAARPCRIQASAPVRDARPGRRPARGPRLIGRQDRQDEGQAGQRPSVVDQYDAAASLDGSRSLHQWWWSPNRERSLQEAHRRLGHGQGPHLPGFGRPHHDPVTSTSGALDGPNRASQMLSKKRTKGTKCPEGLVGIRRPGYSTPASASTRRGPVDGVIDSSPDNGIPPPIKGLPPSPPRAVELSKAAAGLSRPPRPHPAATPDPSSTASSGVVERELNVLRRNRA